MPEPINKSMDEIAEVVLNVPPKKPDEWRYASRYHQPHRKG